MDHVKRILKDYYDLNITDVLPQQGGWASLAYKVSNKQQSYFLKVYEKSRASTPKLTARINQTIPIMVWLMENSSLKGKIPIPFPTCHGEYQCEDESGVYLLYDYIEGETIGDQACTDSQVHQLAEIIAELHSYGEEIPIEANVIKEDFEVPYLRLLRGVLRNGREDLPSDVWKWVDSSRSQLNHLLQRVAGLSQNLKRYDLRMALCHTDLHHWNLMQSGSQLILIDWEGLKLAPVEADLMLLADEPYFNEFWRCYQEKHPNSSIDLDLLSFYQGRRRLEDIWEFIEQLLFDEQDEQERAITINHLREELNGLND